MTKWPSLPEPSSALPRSQNGPDCGPEDDCLFIGKAITPGEIAVFTGGNHVVRGVASGVVHPVAAHANVTALAIVARLALYVFAKPFRRQIASVSPGHIEGAVASDSTRAPASGVEVLPLGSLEHDLPFWGRVKPAVLFLLVASGQLCSGAWAALIAKPQLSIFVSRKIFNGCRVSGVADVTTALAVFVRSICHNADSTMCIADLPTMHIAIHGRN